MDMVKAIIVAGSLFLTTTLIAQARPAFDVASVRPSPNQPDVAVGLHITGSQARITFLSLRDYIALAYRVRPSQVVAPDWASQVRFDIAGNIPDGASRDQVPEMVQSLLADRFQLTM